MARRPQLRRPGGCWCASCDQSACDHSFSGFAYIVNAAVDNQHHTVHIPDKVAGGNNIASSKGAPVPAVTLDSFLPAWVRSVHMLQIDVEGWELHVLQGAVALLRHGKIRRVLFEFSPWRMERYKTGRPIELLEFLPGLGAMCYDATGNYNRLPRPSTPLPAYLSSLYDGKNCDSKYVYYRKHCPGGAVPPNDIYGPIEDIICGFSATSAVQ